MISSKKFLFKEYSIEEFSLDSGNAQNLDKGVHLSLDTNVSADKNTQSLNIRLTITLTQKENKTKSILRLLSISKFSIRDSDIVLDQSFLESEYIPMLVQVVYHTSRGIVLDRVANSPLKNLILPLVDDDIVMARSGVAD